ncbi:SUF system NifU family Fe-S cluster assembly protein [PVC group bacterium (ex Bugula neritina AB1)]|nr:SUF system NifU family Fe-S cluster assembly protein [PVC group bacterium (ex Bugula neritina AB1)]
MSQKNHEQLYQQVILDHHRAPRNFQELSDYTHTAEGFNPLCGDHYSIYMIVNQDNKIEKISFTGDGCAISKASSSIMTTFLQNKTTTEVETSIKIFENFIMGKDTLSQSEINWGSLIAFSGIKNYPSRVKCAILSWKTVKGALLNQNTVSTE